MNKNADPSAKTAEGTELVGDFVPTNLSGVQPGLETVQGQKWGEGKMVSDGWLVG